MMVFLLLPLAGLAYTGWHVYELLPLPVIWRWVVIGLGVASFMLIFLNLNHTIDRFPLWLARWCYNIGNSSVFVLLYLVMVFLVLDVGRLIHLVPKTWLIQNTFTTAAIVVGLFAVFLYGNLHYYNKVREELTLTTDKPLLRPLTLVMMSDLHLGYHNPRKELARWVDLVNAERPDVVLVAGDLIDMSMRPLIEENMAAELRRIEAPVYACLGNHEYFSGNAEAQRFYTDAQIHLLRDSVATVGDLCIIGRDDRMNAQRQSMGILARQADHTKYTVVLDHQPYHLEQAERAGIDLQLSGHTHHGQVWPLSWITDRLYECAFGAHQRGRTNYYVSSGMGIWGGKFRIGTRSEYVVIKIERKK